MNDVVLACQRSVEAVLNDLVPEGSNVVLIDFPNYSNAGDSLIWLGQLAYLARRRARLVYAADDTSYSRALALARAQASDTVVLLNGGGTFGTLWPRHQFRKQVLRDLHGLPVIQLPQSLHFDNEAELDDTAQVISEHGRFVLLVRDEHSQELARRFSCEVRHCPDMAFFLGEVKAPEGAQNDFMVLARSDKESALSWGDEVLSGLTGLRVEQAEWLDDWPLERVLSKVDRLLAPHRGWIDRHTMLTPWVWRHMAGARLRRAASLINHGRVIISDRLHVHILCVLMNKPHVIIDNSYGKVGNFMRAWTSAYPTVRLVGSASEAIYAARALLSELDGDEGG